MTRPTVIDLYPDELHQGPRHYLFIVILDIGNKSCNTLNDLCVKMCISNKTEDACKRIKS